MKVDRIDLSLDDLGVEAPQARRELGQETIIKQDKYCDETVCRALGQVEEGRRCGGRGLHQGHGASVVLCGIRGNLPPCPESKGA